MKKLLVGIAASLGLVLFADDTNFIKRTSIIFNGKELFTDGWKVIYMQGTEARSTALGIDTNGAIVTNIVAISSPMEIQIKKQLESYTFSFESTLVASNVFTNNMCSVIYRNGKKVYIKNTYSGWDSLMTEWKPSLYYSNTYTFNSVAINFPVGKIRINSFFP